MTWALFIEQLLNGVQFGTMLFLMAAGLTLVFGIMDMINLTHGSLYMVGAYFAVTFQNLFASFVLAIVLAVLCTAIFGILLDKLILRFFYGRSHLQQVLVTFGLIFVFNDLVRLVWGPAAMAFDLPEVLNGSIEILPNLMYPSYRLAVLAVGLLIAYILYVLITKSRAGMWVRAGAYDRAMAGAMGVNVSFIFTAVFAIGAALAGFAGMMTAPITSVQIGMGDPILILALVVTVLGGIGSVRGAFIVALLIGIADTYGRVLLPDAVGSVGIYILMVIILAFKPAGLFPARS